MIEIGIFDLKTHLSEMIGRVEQGEEFLVTNRGKAVAVLTSPEVHKRKDAARFFAEMKELLHTMPLAADSKDLRNMIEDGRK